MSLKWKRPGCFILAALLLVLWIQPGMAQEAQTPENDGPAVYPQFGN